MDENNEDIHYIGDIEDLILCDKCKRDIALNNLILSIGNGLNMELTLCTDCINEIVYLIWEELKTDQKTRIIGIIRSIYLSGNTIQ